MTVPEVKLIVLADQAATHINTARSRTQPTKTSPADLRWMRVEEFLRSREISPNTRKAFERDLKQFIDWTDKGWHEITSRDLDRYKTYLKTEPNHRGTLRKSATINRSLAALQSFFKWLTVRDYIPKDPTLLLEKLKADPVLPQEFSQDEVDNLYQAICDRGNVVQLQRRGGDAQLPFVGNSAPNSQTNPHFAAATSLLEQEDIQGAMKELNQAIQLDLSLAEAYTLRGILFMGEKSHQTATEDFAQVTHLQPKSAEAHLNLAKSQMMLKDYQAALESATRAKEIDPKNKEAILMVNLAQRLLDSSQ